MAFTVEDYSDLARLLVEHPEWRLGLRRLLLSDELLTMPETLHQLAEAQRRAEERLAGAEERLSRLEATSQNLAEQMRALVEQVNRLVDVLARTKEVVGGLKEYVLEWTYRDKAPAYFGHLLRCPQVVPINALEDALEAALTPGEFRDVFLLDLLVSGQPRHLPEAPEVWLAVEISSVVDYNDVDRAARRAGLLRRAGYRAVPVAAGEQATLGAEEAARDQNVVLVQTWTEQSEGSRQVKFWAEALEAWVNISS